MHSCRSSKRPESTFCNHCVFLLLKYLLFLSFFIKRELDKARQSRMLQLKRFWHFSPQTLTTWATNRKEIKFVGLKGSLRQRARRFRSSFQISTWRELGEKNRILVLVNAANQPLEERQMAGFSNWSNFRAGKTAVSNFN